MHKVALITGATSGIGREAALLFAREGIHVLATGRSERAGAELLSEIQGTAHFVSADLTQPLAADRLVKTAQERFGGLDYAFNAAGIEGTLRPLADLHEEEWDAVIAANLKSVFLCLKAEIPALIARGGGAIVNVSTNITRIAVPTTAAYTASKAGVEALSLVAAAEYAQHNIRINTIHPGAVDTPLLRRVYPPEAFKTLKEKNPLKKIGHPRDIAEAALWLCSARAGHINAATLLIDGGESLSF